MHAFIGLTLSRDADECAIRGGYGAHSMAGHGVSRQVGHARTIRTKFRMNLLGSANTMKWLMLSAGEVVYTDADWGSQPYRQSISGYAT
jgi:hypothetical protein